MTQIKKLVSVFLCLALLIASLGINGGIFRVLADTEPTHTGSVKQVDALNVRSGPDTGYSVLGQLKTGAVVTIYSTEKDTSGADWFKIAFGQNYGYVLKSYIINVTEIPKYDYDADFETNLAKQNFPESYKVLLRQLHAVHPSWIFLADHLTMTWEEAVTAESAVGQSLVQNGVSSIPASWKSMAEYAYEWSTNTYVSYDSGDWVTAEREVVEYYLEPRNFINENSIYMFLDQTYNPNIQNAEGLQKILNGTFMEGEFPEDTHKTYNDLLMQAAKESGVSPYVLAASILIEQGNKGTGGSISGKVKGFEGYYNFFNIRAWRSGDYDAVSYGLLYAKGGSDGKGTSFDRPWNTRAKSIIGGAKYYAKGYVNRGQDNLYYKKFNVISPSFYANQYMTNVQGAYLETSKLKNAYSSVNTDAALTFSIPVYKSMPEQNTTALPTSKGANNYYITSLKINDVAVEGFSKYKNEYEMIFDENVSEMTVTATVPEGAKVEGGGKVSLKQGKNEIKLTVTAASGKTAVYTLYVFRQKGGSQLPTAIPEPSVEGSYDIGTYVSGVAPGTDVQAFIKNFKVVNGTAKVFAENGTQKTTGTIVTGDTIGIYNNAGTQKLKYRIVIFGDVNSDGKISIVDLALVKKHLLQVSKLSGYQSTAADTNRDNKISILDLARVKKHLLKISEIEQ